MSLVCILKGFGETTECLISPPYSQDNTKNKGGFIYVYVEDESQLILMHCTLIIWILY
jgi:hypothetical protein